MGETLAVDTLEAQCVRITDKFGQTRCTLKCDGNGNPFIDFADSGGKSRLIISSLEDEGCSITFYSQDNGPVLLLTMSPNNEPRIWLYKDGEEDPRIGLLIDNEDGAYCHLWHRGPGDGGIHVCALSDGRSEIRVTSAGAGGANRITEYQLEIDGAGGITVNTNRVGQPGNEDFSAGKSAT